MTETKPRRRRGEGKTTGICPGCGKEFIYHLCWPRKYCSNVCAGKANVANVHHFVPTGYDKPCEQCGKIYHVKPKGTRGRFCSMRCWGDWLSIHQRGEAHPNWRGGDVYYGGNWQKRRRQVRARDKVCQMCGKTPEENGGVLEVHHIIPLRSFEHLEEANALSNLTALCGVCHDLADKTY